MHFCKAGGSGEHLTNTSACFLQQASRFLKRSGQLPRDRWALASLRSSCGGDKSPCWGQVSTEAFAGARLEPNPLFVAFVTTASHGNDTCEMTGMALISVGSCWGYWESIFCFGNIMFGFPKQNFEGFLFHENFKCWLTSWFKIFFFFLKTQKSCNKNSHFQPALLMLQLGNYFSSFFSLHVIG